MERSEKIIEMRLIVYETSAILIAAKAGQKIARGNLLHIIPTKIIPITSATGIAGIARKSYNEPRVV